MVSGIGCSARIAGTWTSTPCTRCTEGRWPSPRHQDVAARPARSYDGDGDALAIGQPFHPRGAAQYQAHRDRHESTHRRHDRGAVLPLSGIGVSATTAPYGNIDREFDTVAVALGAGATFVARTTTYTCAR
ncbi:MAG: hypothetical protein ACLR0N_03805 [Bilophila wadsworthia]